MAADRTPNELADALEHDAQRVMWHDEVLQKDDACRWGGVDTLHWAMDMRAAAALLRVQGEQLDTLPLDKFEMQKLLDRALQEAWDDYVGDTHCHPPDFTVEGGRSNYTLSASFRSNWTLYAAERLSLWLAAAVPQDPERCACGKPATGTVDGVPTCGDDR